MDFTLPEELRMLRATVARFAREELRPLEKDVIRREAERAQGSLVTLICDSGERYATTPLLDEMIGAQ